MIDIRPLKTMEDFENLKACAEADGHGVIAPTHLVTKDNMLVGGLEIMPAVFVWMNTKLTKVRDSLELMRFYEAHLACQGNRTIVLPCSETSPYFPVLPGVKYQPLPHKLFIKGL